MVHQNRIVSPGRTERNCSELIRESSWQFRKGGLCFRLGTVLLPKWLKAKGLTWLVRVKFKNRFISKGIWAKEEHIAAAKEALQAKRSAPGYAKKRQQDLARKKQKHGQYVHDFYTEVLDFLAFHPRYTALAAQLASSVTELATPVGSKTVARTERIPLEDRARSAVIAWMRHRTTGYDRMIIAPVKGKRRQVRRELACRSIDLLQAYREGLAIPLPCPLQKALADEEEKGSPGSLL